MGRSFGVERAFCLLLLAGASQGGSRDCVAIRRDRHFLCSPEEFAAHAAPTPPLRSVPLSVPPRGRESIDRKPLSPYTTLAGCRTIGLKPAALLE
jgi:hypothetical protein